MHELPVRKRVLLCLMAAAYVLAGINHFVHPQTYLRIMPAFVPLPQVANWLSGAAEILLGALVLFPSTRNMAAWGIILLLIAVFPANIQMLVDYSVHRHPLTWAAWVRLPLQGILIWWAYQYTNLHQRRHSK